MNHRFLPGLLVRAGLRYQERHRWQALLALSGIVLGVAVVLAVDLANSAAKASFRLSSEQLRGAATHRLVSADGRVPQQVYTDLFTAPGHPPMAPVITADVRIEQRPGRWHLVGLDIFAEGAFRAGLPDAIRGQFPLAEWLARPDTMALSRAAAQALRLSVGETLPVAHQGRSHRLTLFAVSETDSVGSRTLIVVDIATAQAITAMQGWLSHVDLILDDAAVAWIRTRLPDGVRLVDVDDQTRGAVALSASFELNLTAMSLLALLVGMFLIFNAMSFSIVQRRRLLGRLRALGVRGEEISRLILAEALVLATVGTGIGILLGIWLGQGLTAIVAATVSELYYEVTTDATALNPRSIGKAVALGLGGTLIASWLPARQAARTPPLTTLSRAALEDSTRARTRHLALVGAVLLGCGIVIALHAPGGVVAGFAGLFVVIIGAALTTPAALRLAHVALVRLRFGGIWRMAVRDLDRHLSRLGTAAAALMVALSASIGVAVMVDSMRGSVSDWLDDLLNADLYVAAAAFEDDAPLPAGIVDAVAGLDAVDAISTYRGRELDTVHGRLTLIAADLATTSRNGFRLLSTATGAPWRLFDHGAVLISEPLAHRLRLDAGDRLILPTPAGDVAFDVAAVFRDYASEHGRVFVDARHYTRLWPDRAIDNLALFSGRGSDALIATLNKALGDRDDLAFTAPRAIHEESMAVFDRTFHITEVLRLLSLLVAFIGVFSALMAVQLERRKEFAVLRALGLTRLQVGTLILIESAALGLLASLVALPAGIAMAWILTESIQLRAFGWTMPFLVAPAPLLLTLAVGLLAALLAGVYPAWVSGRRDPATLLRED